MNARSFASSGFISGEFSDAYPLGIEHHYWSIARNGIICRLLRRVMADPHDPVLEIGCGTGIVTDHLRRQGIQCIGCDIGRPSPCNREIAPFLKLGIDAFALPADLRDPVRVVLLLDVLEHLEDPAHFLRCCRTRFPNLQSILFTVPAREEVWSNYDEYYRHFTRYDHFSIHDLVAPESYLLANWGYFFHALYPAARLLKVMDLKRQTRLSAPRVEWPHRLIAALFELEQCVVPRWAPGTSLYGVLKCV